MNKTWPVKSFPSGKAAVSFVLLLSAAISSPASAQTTYWLPSITKTASATTYTYNVKAPDYFGAWLTKKTAIGGGDIVTKTIDGKDYRFIKQTFSWYKPMSTHGLNIETAGVNQFGGGEWVNDNAFKTQNAVIAALESHVIESSATHGKAMVLALIHQGDASPGLVYIEKGSESAIQLETHEQIMGKLAESVSPGTYFPNVKKPADLLALQQEMLRYGNIGRRDPDFRKLMGSKTATNLEADSVQTQNGTEKVFKTSPKAPYFRDHTLREDLNNLAQFQAEYQATIGRVTHDGPGSYVLNGKNLNVAKFHERAKSLETAANWEACAGGPPGSFPKGWMTGETHFRPWFNVGDFQREVGYGAARAADGTWYYAAVGIAKKEEELPADQRLAVPPGPLTRGKRYLTADGSRFLMFAEDGNVVVGGVADGRYFWGLNARPGVNWQKSASVHVTNEGRFEVRDATGTVIWAIPDNPTPGSVLDLNQLGVPRMTKPGSQVESYSLPLAPGTTIQQGEKYDSTDGQHYLIHAGVDNNLMIVRTADEAYVWGLDQQTGVDFRQAAVVRFNAAGTLEVLDGSGKVIYQTKVGNPGARLGLDATGKFTAQ